MQINTEGGGEDSHGHQISCNQGRDCEITVNSY